MYLQQTDVPASSARNATKLLNLHPYTTTVVQKAYETDRTAKLNFVNWYLHGVQNRGTDPTLVLLSEEAWFHSVDK